MNARERQLAVYASEEAALGGAGREFRHLGEVRAYVDELIAGDWWADRWPHVEAIPVGRSRSDRFGGYAVEGTGEIRLGGRASGSRCCSTRSPTSSRPAPATAPPSWPPFSTSSGSA